jgi:hypothetical protein
MKGQCGVGLDEGKHLVQRAHGYAIAEFAIAIPALLFVLAISLSVVGLTITQIKLESAATLGARMVGRGDQIPESFLNSLPAGTEVVINSEIEVVEVKLTNLKEIGFKSFPLSVELTATSRARLELEFE